MSELINERNGRNDFRHRLLMTVSALALVGSLWAMPDAKASDDTDRPTVWIELGGQLERMDGAGEPYAPAFIAAYPDSPVFHPVSPSQADKAPLFAIGGESRISFQPAGTNWVLSASVLYGRSNTNKEVNHQVTPTAVFTIYGHHIAKDAKFADTRTLQSEAHTIVDFQVGKDVGLGMFGKNSTSLFSLGVRFAQFASRADVNMKARPDLRRYNPAATFYQGYYFHEYTAAAQSKRSFRGIGPSVSWKASAPVVGNPDNGEINLDWGLNAAVLFGRQKASTVHSTTARYHNRFRYASYSYYPPNFPKSQALYYHAPHPLARARFVTVPNVGGFAGITISRSVAKVSFGYRADMFFGAVDGGWDAAHKENLSFHGPYATISIGLGG